MRDSPTTDPQAAALLKRLHDDKARRQRERDEDLQRYEQELAIRREQRLAERAGRRGVEVDASALTARLTADSVANSLRVVEVKRTQDHAIHVGLVNKSRQLQTRIQDDRANFQLREKHLDQWREMKRRKRPPAQHKQFVMQSVDFYGADFAPEASVEKTLLELKELARAKEVEFEAHPDRVNLFVEKGEALVKALEEARRLAPSDVQSHATKNLKRGDSKVDAEAIAASLSPEEQAAHRAAAERRDSLTEFLASPLSIPTRKSPSRIRKKWLEAVPKRHIDYSAYFTSNIGLKEGLVVFRIDDLKPVLVPAAKQHTLCLGDCYIVLNTFESEQGNGRLEWSIYQWIGDRAALDKKACSAIFAVGLRNHLGASSEVRRELAHEESTAFLELFATLDTELSYVEAAKATPSGLFKVQAVEYPLRIYRVQAAAIERQGKVIRKLGDDFALALMEPVVESLSSHYSYLIDNGLRIYTWNGKDAPLSDRSKCRLLGEKICKSERPAGKARLDVVEEGEELPDFWETFDGERRSTVVKADAEQTKATIPSPKLYVFNAELVDTPAAVVDLQSVRMFPKTAPTDDTTVTTNYRPSRHLLLTDACAVLDCGTELYMWVGKKSSAKLRQLSEHLLINKIFPSSDEPRPAYMATGKFMESVEPEVFKARFHRWDAAFLKGVDYSNSKPTNARIGLGMTRSSAVAQVKVHVQALYSSPPNGKTTLAEERMMEALFDKADRLLETLQCFVFDDVRRTFVRLPEWRVDGGREKGHLWSEDTYVFLCVYKRELKSGEDADRASAGRAGRPLNSTAMPSAPRKLGDTKFDASPIALAASRGNLQPVPEAEQVSTRECVTYLWSGAQVSKPSFAQLTFTHQFRGQIQKLIDSASRGRMQMHTVMLEQERESIALLSHFGRDCVVHMGKRPASFPKQFDGEDAGSWAVPGSPVSGRARTIDLNMVHLYHIRTENTYKITRAVEVNPVVTSLVSRDCFLLTTAGYNNADIPCSADNTFIWVGKGVSRDEERRALMIARRMVDFSVTIGSRSKDDRFQIVREGSETHGFWRNIGPTFGAAMPLSSIVIPSGQGFHYCTPPPRMFRCTTETGYFQVIDIGLHFTKADLLSNSVCFLDAAPGLGRPYVIWAWIGAEVSEVVQKMSKKAMDSYLDHWNDGRTLDGSEWHQEEEQLAILRSSQSLRKSNTAVEAPPKAPERSGRRRMDALAAASPSVMVIRQHREPVEFKAFFLGWGDSMTVDEEARRKLNIVDRVVPEQSTSVSRTAEPASEPTVVQLEMPPVPSVIVTHGDGNDAILKESQDAKLMQAQVFISEQVHEEEGQGIGLSDVQVVFPKEFHDAIQEFIHDVTEEKANDTNVEEVDDTNVGEAYDTNVEEVDDTNVKEVGDTNLEKVDGANVKEVGDTNLEKVDGANVKEVEDTDVKEVDDTPNALQEKAQDVNVQQVDETNAEEDVFTQDNIQDTIQVSEEMAKIIPDISAYLKALAEMEAAEKRGELYDDE